MLTFFQHFFIGKMEEETQNDEEVVNQAQPASEHSDETAKPDAPKRVDENTEKEVSDSKQAAFSSNVSPAASEGVPDPAESSAGDEAQEVAEASEADETPENEGTPKVEQVPETEKILQVETEETPDINDMSKQEETPEVVIISDTSELSESDGVSESLDVSDTDETPEVIVIPDVTDSSEVEEIPESLEVSDTEKIPEIEEISEAEAPEVEEIPIPSEPQISYVLGKSEELFDFVNMFDDSECSGTEQISMNMADSAGGVMKPALFAHPSSNDSARIAYELTLPQVEENENLCLYFSIGLRDGVVLDDPRRHPGGVRFSVEIYGERCFESVSTECRWAQNGVNLTQYAGKKVELAFVTQCHVGGNSNFAWALWGQPRLLKLSRAEERHEDEQSQTSEIQCGLAIAKLLEDRIALFEFDRGNFVPASEIAAEIYNQLDVEPIELVLYAAQPKLEIVSVGPTAAVVCKSEAFQIQCTIKNVGLGPLGKDSKTRLSINDIKLRRGRSGHNAPGDTSTYIWYARGVSRQTDINFTVSLKSSTVELDKRMKGVVQIRPPQPKLNTQVVPELHTYMHGDHVVLGNKNLRFILVHNGEQ